MKYLVFMRSSAARAAHRGQVGSPHRRSYICCNAPFQSGHGCSPWCMAEDRWGAGSASREIASCQQGWQLWPHRPWHVATNVGAGLPREAPRGRRSICASPQNPSQAPGSPNPISRQTYRNPTHQPIPKAHQAPYQPAQPPALSPLQPSLHYGTTPTHYQQPLARTPRYWPPALPG